MTNPTQKPRLPDFLLAEPIGFHLPSLAAWLQRWERLQERFDSAALMRVATGGVKAEPLTLGDFVNQRQPYQVTQDGTAMIHVNDGLSRTCTKFDQMLGMTHYNVVMGELAQAKADPNVKGAMLNVSSPGGSVVGAPEAAATVADFRNSKPIVTHIETVGASAAFYLAAASNAIVVSPSAIVGSIGTIGMFPNIAGLLAAFGVEMNIVTPKQSDLKASGNMFRKPTVEESAFLQERIEAINADFCAWVQQYRPASGPDSMRGQWFSGKQAVTAGLADFVGDRDFALAQLAAFV